MIYHLMMHEVTPQTKHTLFFLNSTKLELVEHL
jgi:hypothetical protein